MTTKHNANDSFPANLLVGQGTCEIPEVPEFTEAQRLAWEFCDGAIADDQRKRLEDLLRESGEARSQYISVVSIHQSLIEIFNPSTYSPPHGILPK